MAGYAVGPGAGWQVRREQQLLAESVPCPCCRAEQGQGCRNLWSGEPLARLPAHLARLQAADVPL